MNEHNSKNLLCISIIIIVFIFLFKDDIENYTNINSNDIHYFNKKDIINHNREIEKYNYNPYTASMDENLIPKVEFSEGFLEKNSKVDEEINKVKLESSKLKNKKVSNFEYFGPTRYDVVEKFNNDNFKKVEFYGDPYEKEYFINPGTVDYSINYHFNDDIVNGEKKRNNDPFKIGMIYK